MYGVIYVYIYVAFGRHFPWQGGLFFCVCVFGITEMYLINNIMQKMIKRESKLQNACLVNALNK